MDKKQYDVEILKLLKQYQKFKELLTANIQYDIILKDTVFTRVSARAAHLILSSQTGVLIRGRRSFEGGAH